MDRQPAWRAIEVVNQNPTVQRTKPDFPMVIVTSNKSKGLLLLTLMPFGNSDLSSRRDWTTIARRFNAGMPGNRGQVPKGPLKTNPKIAFSIVPSGLTSLAVPFPALKRRAIIEMSLRDNQTPHDA